MPRPGPRRDAVAFKLDGADIKWTDDRALSEGLTIRGGEPHRSEMLRLMWAYAQRHMPKGWRPMPTSDSILAAHLGQRLFVDPELDLDDLDHVQEGDGFTIDSAGSHGGKVRRTGVKADDWERVKAAARENAQWLADTDEGALLDDRADYA